MGNWSVSEAGRREREMEGMRGWQKGRGRGREREEDWHKGEGMEIDTRKGKRKAGQGGWKAERKRERDRQRGGGGPSCLCVDDVWVRRSKVKITLESSWSPYVSSRWISWLCYRSRVCACARACHGLFKKNRCQLYTVMATFSLWYVKALH